MTDEGIELLREALGLLHLGRDEYCPCSECSPRAEARRLLRYDIQQWLDSTEDPRKTGLKTGLRQLDNIQIQRVLDYPGEFVLDEFNYHEGKFCPLAVALELDKTMAEPTNEKVQNLLRSYGLKINNTRGIEGEFYTTNRLEDLRLAAQEVLLERGVLITRDRT